MTFIQKYGFILLIIISLYRFYYCRRHEGSEVSLKFIR